MSTADAAGRMAGLRIDAMTLVQLRVFVAVAERQHVTRAAAALNLSQSAVSAAIAALEEEHGVRLFDRVGRGVTLAPPGRVFLREARAVLERAGQASATLRGCAPALIEPGGAVHRR